MARKIPLIVNDFKLTTWLIVGAFLQSLTMLVMPSSYAVMVPSLLLGARLIATYLEAKGYLPSSSVIYRGRWTAHTLDNLSEPPKRDVIVFILGARTLHPMGRLAGGFKESRNDFAAMWDDAESNREKWGFLGKSEPLISDTHGGMSIVWITYWRDIQGLRNFAAGDAHRKGWSAYVANKFPNLGIMHETYCAPEGSWENIYYSWPPFGFGEAALHLQNADLILRKADGALDTSLISRMQKASQKDAVGS
ncbi:unnamed protein product [Periconia digitata]|uniref:Monooxygenase n=1 Tax=Periconia digitata TaxID=1303443 RepID=A0A9W4UBN4_9PLEO|nr:unnamed protein product [Periconia digitata]